MDNEFLFSFKKYTMSASVSGKRYFSFSPYQRSGESIQGFHFFKTFFHYLNLLSSSVRFASLALLVLTLRGRVFAFPPQLGHLLEVVS